MTLLLVHSGLGDAGEWDLVRRRLAPGREVIAPDLHGFGKSPLPDRAWSHAAQLRDLLDGPATVCGASFGGMVALELAALAPERVARLVLLSPALEPWEWGPEMREFGEHEEALLEAGDVDAAVELNVGLWAPPGHEAEVRARQAAAFALQLEETVERDEVAIDAAAITVPTTILVGGADPIPDFPAIARHLAATIPGAELRVLEGAGHLLALERPDAVAAALA